MNKILQFNNPELDFQRKLKQVAQELNYFGYILAPHEIKKRPKEPAEVIDFTNKEK